MWLKIVILVLIVAMLASLSSALVFLLKDFGNESRRTVYTLGIRVAIALLLLVCITYGFASGILTNTAPWAGKY